jgi:hypothetical protein
MSHGASSLAVGVSKPAELARVARRERRPASAVPTSAQIILIATFDFFIHGLILAVARESVPDLGYFVKLLSQSPQSVRRRASNVARWPMLSKKSPFLSMIAFDWSAR